MTPSELERRLARLKDASRLITRLSTEKKNQVLLKVAAQLEKKQDAILEANHEDLNRLDQEPAGHVTSAFRDRLTLNATRIQSMSESIRAVARLPDPVGEIVESRTLENGLKIRRVRSPLGTILMIFESRPNVITEVFALAFKSGNAIALRGGSDSRATATVLYGLIENVLQSEMAHEAPMANPTLPFVGIEDYDRALVGRLLQRDDVFDICIPRGGHELIHRVTNESKMPIIKNDKGVCHLYVHAEADLEMAVRIALNAKVQRPGVCNSIETILVDRSRAREFLLMLTPAMHSEGVHFFAAEEAFKVLREIAKTDGVESAWAANLHQAEEADFYREYLDLKLNIKIVDDLDAAIFHIAKFGSNHSESIITKNEKAARRFQNEVDSACVYWNASTRFTDGFEMGLGGEIGISTQKLHVRGPVGLRELTSPRWLVDGTGQTRL